MKSIFKYLPVIALAVAATACDDLIDDKSVIDAKYSVGVPSVELKDIYALGPQSVAVSYSISSVAGIAAAGLELSTDDSFTNSTYISFDDEVVADGTSTVSGLAENTSYYARMFCNTVDGIAVSEAVKQFSTPEVWKSLGMATVTDDYLTTFFSVENVSWEVEIQENLLEPGCYRLVDPYAEAYPNNEPGDWDANVTFYLYIHAEDPNKVYIPVLESSMNWGYGNFIFGSLAGYYIDNGREDLAEGKYGTLAEGVITFPVKSLLVAMSDYQDGGLYTANSNGAFKVVLPAAGQK